MRTTTAPLRSWTCEPAEALGFGLLCRLPAYVFAGLAAASPGGQLAGEPDALTSPLPCRCCRCQPANLDTWAYAMFGSVAAQGYNATAFDIRIIHIPFLGSKAATAGCPTLFYAKGDLGEHSVLPQSAVRVTCKLHLCACVVCRPSCRASPCAIMGGWGRPASLPVTGACPLPLVHTGGSALWVNHGADIDPLVVLHEASRLRNWQPCSCPAGGMLLLGIYQPKSIHVGWLCPQAAPMRQL